MRKNPTPKRRSCTVVMKEKISEYKTRKKKKKLENEREEKNGRGTGEGKRKKGQRLIRLQKS